MKKVRCWLTLAGVSLLLALSACDDDPASGEVTCGTATYILTPNGGGGDLELMEKYIFRCKDSSLQPDIEFTYEDCPDESGDFFSYYAGGSNQQFIASWHGYEFSGSTLRAFGYGSQSAFAIGAYVFGAESGTFVFHEGDVGVPNDTECP